MRLGCCGSMISPAADPVGAALIEPLAELGFDYIELSLADLTALPEPAFAELARRLERSDIRCEACNNFFPPHVRLTGSEASLPAALAYACAALERAARLGVSIVVFGSSGAKNVPHGFPHDAARRQLVELLRHLGPLAEEYDLTIAIEPLNRREANIINRAAEGLELAREAGHQRIQLLIDYYHLLMEREDPGVVLQCGAALRHLHLAAVEGRGFPDRPDNDMLLFFRELNRIRYSGRCSIEAYTADFATDARRGLRVLRELIEKSVEE